MNLPALSPLLDRAFGSQTGSATTLVGHRGGGGDLISKRVLTRGTDWSKLEHRPDHYEYRDEWANRLKTFERMWGKGVREFELDVLPSKSTRPTMVHNSIIDGKHVSQWTDAELEAKGNLALDSLLGAFERFPGFAERKPRLLIELKGSHSAEELTDAGENGVAPESQKLVEDVVAMLTRRVQSGKWTYDQLPIIGFNHGMLKLAKQLNPDLQVATTFGKENFGFAEEQMFGARERPDFGALVDQMISQAKEAGAFAINPDSRLVDARLVTAAHQSGLQVNPWFSFRVQEAPRELLALKVDALITDKPLKTARLQRRMAVEDFLKSGPPSRPSNAAFLAGGAVAGSATAAALGWASEEPDADAGR